MLTQAGYEVIASDSGEDSIVKAKTTHPDLILMDVVMPGLNGFQATRAISRAEGDGGLLELQLLFHFSAHRLATSLTALGTDCSC